MQEIEYWPYEQIVYAQPKICPGEWDAQNSLGFRDTNGWPNLSQKTRPSDSQQKQKTKRNCHIVNFAVPDDHRGKLKESEKRDTEKRTELNWNLLCFFISLSVTFTCTKANIYIKISATQL